MAVAGGAWGRGLPALVVLLATLNTVPAALLGGESRPPTCGVLNPLGAFDSERAGRVREGQVVAVYNDITKAKCAEYCLANDECQAFAFREPDGLGRISRCALSSTNVHLPLNGVWPWTFSTRKKETTYSYSTGYATSSAFREDVDLQFSVEGCSTFPLEDCQTCPKGHYPCGHTSSTSRRCPWLQAQLICCPFTEAPTLIPIDSDDFVFSKEGCSPHPLSDHQTCPTGYVTCSRQIEADDPVCPWLQSRLLCCPEGCATTEDRRLRRGRRHMSGFSNACRANLTGD